MTTDSGIVLMGDSIQEFTPKNFTFFKKPTYYDMSELKLEGLKKFAEIIQWGRRNPVKFCERFFGIEFLDWNDEKNRINRQKRNCFFHWIDGCIS